MKIVTLVFVPLIMIGTLLADINDKIQSNQVSIDRKKSQEKKISQQLDKIAKEMSIQKRNLHKLTKDISTCKSTIQKLKKKTVIKGSELKKIENLYRKLTNKRRL